MKMNLQSILGLTPVNAIPEPPMPPANEEAIDGGIVDRDITAPNWKQTQVINPECAELLVKQIGREMYNYNLYTTFASLFAKEGLYKMVKYYKDRAREEYNHQLWIVDYLTFGCVVFTMPQADAIDIDVLDPIYTLEKVSSDVVKAEIETTEWINTIYDKACEVGDKQTKKWLTKLIDEQVEEESLSLKVNALCNQCCDWITKQDAVEEYYNMTK